jgi:hypothetical protein
MNNSQKMLSPEQIETLLSVLKTRLKKTCSVM